MLTAAPASLFCQGIAADHFRSARLYWLLFSNSIVAGMMS